MDNTINDVAFYTIPVIAFLFLGVATLSSEAFDDTPILGAILLLIASYFSAFLYHKFGIGLIGSTVPLAGDFHSPGSQLTNVRVYPEVQYVLNIGLNCVLSQFAVWGIFTFLNK